MDHLNDAIRALSGDSSPVAEAATHVPATPGLYAIYGDERAWRDLDLTPGTDLALYVGRSRSDLRKRELGAHFAVLPGQRTQTGSSTVRRSFAALLADRLDLKPIHRSTRNPDPKYATNYGLTASSDESLTRWMHARLSVVVWQKPDRLSLGEQDQVEASIVHSWMPPLNIEYNPRPLPRLVEGRARMTAIVRSQSAPVELSDPTPTSPPVTPQHPREARRTAPTPRRVPQLAAELDVDQKKLRRQLRKVFQGPGRGGEWELTDQHVEYARHLNS